mgnify:CR=1 FL=1
MLFRSELPTQTALDPAYPNPFNPQTTVPFAIDRSAHVHLAVFDILGRQVETLVDSVLPAGAHSVVFDASRVPSGTYLVRMVADGVTATRMVTLLK